MFWATTSEKITLHVVTFTIQAISSVSSLKQFCQIAYHTQVSHQIIHSLHAFLV